MLQKLQSTMQVMHNLFILARNQLRFAISFLLFISFDFQNYNFNCYLINHNSINKDSYFSNLIVIKADFRVRLLQLIKISYSKTSIDLYYQILQTRPLRSQCNRWVELEMKFLAQSNPTGSIELDQNQIANPAPELDRSS